KGNSWTKMSHRFIESTLSPSRVYSAPRCCPTRRCSRRPAAPTAAEHQDVGRPKMSWLQTDAAALEGTAYFEFLPGRYAGECWGRQSVFLTEQAFAHIEPIFQKHRPDFDHYAFTEIA